MLRNPLLRLNPPRDRLPVGRVFAMICNDADTNDIKWCEFLAIWEFGNLFIYSDWFKKIREIENGKIS